jgi:hypothetical protein
MSYHTDKLDKLTEDERDALLDFLENITEGDILIIANEMQMDQADKRKLCRALENFQEA